MNGVGQVERATQNRVIALFRDDLGYPYLEDWTARDGKSDVEEGLLSASLTKTRQLKQGMMQELLTGRIRLV